jgi:hypothetical protein
MNALCSRPSRTPGWDYDFFVDFSAENTEQIARVSETLKGITKQVKVVSASPTNATNATVGMFILFLFKKNYSYAIFNINVNILYDLIISILEQVPWFPRKKSDLDTYANKVLEMGEELGKNAVINISLVTIGHMFFDKMLLCSLQTLIILVQMILFIAHVVLRLRVLPKLTVMDNLSRKFNINLKRSPLGELFFAI